jgi:hypothetical protein
VDGSGIASQSISYYTSGFLALAFEYFSKKSLCSCPVSTALNKNIQYITLLINGAPEIVLLTTDRYKDLVHEPGIAESAFTSFQGSLELRSKLQAHASNPVKVTMPYQRIRQLRQLHWPNYP